MIRLKILFLVSILLLSSQAFNQIFLHRSLVFAGGGLDDKNSSVYNQLIHLAGGTEKAAFVNLFLEGIFSEKVFFHPKCLVNMKLALLMF